jgi:hypothetical protein
MEPATVEATTVTAACCGLHGATASRMALVRTAMPIHNLFIHLFIADLLGGGRARASLIVSLEECFWKTVRGREVRG